MGYKRLEAKIYGRVQGVGYRYFTEIKAEALGITGWVANLWDGTVKVVAEGPEDKINEFLFALWQGPRLAVVEDIKYELKDIDQPTFTSFDVRFGDY